MVAESGLSCDPGAERVTERGRDLGDGGCGGCVWGGGGREP